MTQPNKETATPDLKKLLSDFARKHYAMAADEHKEGASDESVRRHYDEANTAEGALIAAIDAQSSLLSAQASTLEELRGALGKARQVIWLSKISEAYRHTDDDKAVRRFADTHKDIKGIDALLTPPPPSAD